MPHDLFGDVATRPSSVRSRRSPLVFVSLAAHGAVLAGLVITSVVAPDALPFPETVEAWNPRLVRLVDIPLPNSPPVQTNTAQDRGAVALPSADPAPATPVVAPDGIEDKTGNEKFGGGPLRPEPEAPVGVVPGTPLFEPDPAPPARAPDGPVRLHAGIRTPRKIVDVAPVYPVLAQQLRIDGVVILEATIDTQGAVQTARVLRSVPMLDQAAVDAVRQWRFEPAMLNDQPIAVVMTVTVRFSLR